MMVPSARRAHADTGSCLGPAGRGGITRMSTTRPDGTATHADGTVTHTDGTGTALDDAPDAPGPHASDPAGTPGGPAGIRGRVLALVEHPRFHQCITTLIIINAVLLGLETYPSIMTEFGDLMHVVNAAILTVFVIEIVLRIIAHGARFFTDGWSIFDFLIVVVSLIPFSGGLQILRVLRVLRVLRLMSSVPSLRKVVGALVSAVPGIAAIGGLLVLIMYVFVVACTMLFGHISPAAFGDLGTSTVSLFRLLNGDGWGELVEPLAAQVPYAWPFMMIYGLISTFVILNLFIAVTCEALDSQKDEETELTIKERRLMDEIDALKRSIETIEAAVTSRGVSSAGRYDGVGEGHAHESAADGTSEGR